MPIALIGLIVFIAVVIFIMTLEYDPLIPGVAFTTAILAVLWIIAASLQPARYERESLHEVYSIKNVDLLIIDDEIVNLNEHFNRKFAEGDKILVKIVEDGPYLGTYGWKKNEYKVVENRNKNCCDPCECDNCGTECCQ